MLHFYRVSLPLSSPSDNPRLEEKYVQQLTEHLQHEELQK